MARFQSGGFSLAYDDIRPAGPAVGDILLIHGFAASRGESWKRLGWYAAFERKSWRAVAPDLRGHGDSDKPRDATAYARAEMIGDLIALMDQLSLGRPDVMGYSMGAHLAIGLALRHPERVGRLILGGVGARAIDGGGPITLATMSMAQAMRIDDPESIPDRNLKGFRRFADQQGDDRLALAACSEGRGRPVTADDFAAISAPTLIVAGALDEIAGDPGPLADAIPGARWVTLPGCDHFTAIPHALFKAAVFDFLEGWDEGPTFE